MYFTVSWDMRTEMLRWEDIDEELRSCFENYPQIRVLKNFYIVKVSSTEEADTIFQCLLNVAQHTRETVIFIMSPVLTGKTWRGYMTPDVWTRVLEVLS